MIDALAWEKGENMREHEKTAGGSRKGKKSRRRGFLFSSLCRPLSSLMLSACVLCVCCVCVRVSNILCDGESSLYKRRYRPGIVCMFFRSHITHHTPPRRICAHSPHIISGSAPAQNYSKIFLFLLQLHVYKYTICCTQ